MDVVAEAAALGCGGVVVAAAGFAEAGGDGAALQTSSARCRREQGNRRVGPNCAGSRTFRSASTCSPAGASTCPRAASPHAVGSASCRRAGSSCGRPWRRRRSAQLGVSIAVSSGNEAVCDLADHVDRARRRSADIGDLPRDRDRAPSRGVLRRRRRGAGGRQAGDRPEARPIRSRPADHAVAHRRDRRRELGLRPRLQRARASSPPATSTICSTAPSCSCSSRRRGTAASTASA